MPNDFPNFDFGKSVSLVSQIMEGLGTNEELANMAVSAVLNNLGLSVGEDGGIFYY